MADKPVQGRVLAAAACLPVAIVAVGLAAGAGARPVPGAPKCPLFPEDSHWNLPVDDLPVLAGSSRMVKTIGAGDTMHADFGSGRYEGARIGIPFVVVPGSQRKRKVRFRYRDESDRVRYPIPRDPPIEGGKRSRGDRHVIMVDRDRCKLYELYAAYPRRRGWRAGSGAVWNLRSNKLRPAGWTSADAAGLPILPGLARFDEVRRGRIGHALRFTVERTRRDFIYPARHFASESNDPDLPAMGQRFRLKADYPIGRFPRQARIVLKALKRYGMIVADNGSNWFVSGQPSSRWDNDQLRSLHEVPGRAFEVVDTSALPRPKG